jgi:hypothetical protein
MTRIIPDPAAPKTGAKFSHANVQRISRGVSCIVALKLRVRAEHVKNIAEWLAWLYVLTNAVRIFFYAPQIRAVLKCEDGAAAVSITTWAFWTFANLTGALYGWFVIHDRAFSLIFAGNLACTAAVTLIAIVKRFTVRVA